MAKKGQTFKKHSAEYKLCVILDMREHGLSYRETERKYELSKTSIKAWERIYLEEGVAGLMKERRGRNSRGRRRKPLPAEVEEDLIAENQRLREQNWRLEMELEYLKKLDALVRAEEERNGKKPK